MKTIAEATLVCREDLSGYNLKFDAELTPAGTWNPPIIASVGPTRRGKTVEKPGESRRLSLIIAVYYGELIIAREFRPKNSPNMVVSPTP